MQPKAGMRLCSTVLLFSSHLCACLNIALAKASSVHDFDESTLMQRHQPPNEPVGARRRRQRYPCNRCSTRLSNQRCNFCGLFVCANSNCAHKNRCAVPFEPHRICNECHQMQMDNAPQPVLSPCAQPGLQIANSLLSLCEVCGQRTAGYSCGNCLASICNNCRRFRTIHGFELTCLRCVRREASHPATSNPSGSSNGPLHPSSSSRPTRRPLPLPRDRDDDLEHEPEEEASLMQAPLAKLLLSTD